MTYKQRTRASLALVLAAVLLLSACGMAAGPGAALRQNNVVASANVAPTPEATQAPQAREADAETLAAPAGDLPAIEVDSIDSLLAALRSDAVISLKPGTYDLAAASDYGYSYRFGPYTWEETYDGYELVIRDVQNLALFGAGTEATVISAEPRYADVLHFENCRGLSLAGFTAGHTKEPGECAGGVLYFDSCIDTYITNCGLYGCGIVGIQTVNCDRLTAENTDIYECSYGAFWAESSRDVRLVDSRVHDCGYRYRAFNLFQVSTSTGFAVVNTVIENNNVMTFLSDSSSDEVYLLGCEIINNQIGQAFLSSVLSPVVDGCAFTDNDVENWFESGGYAVALDGTKLGKGELEAMQLRSLSYDGPAIPQAPAVEGIPTQEGMEYHVSTMDEFLAVIGSDTTIYLEGELFDISTASNYGGYGGEHIYWTDIYDGPGLVIADVNNLRIIGQGKGATTLEAVPRYADVRRFVNCSNVTVASLTAGHVKGEPGSCMGDVLAFEDCRDFHVIDCGLFGCGVYGIRANNSVSGEILRTEIYECSMGAAQIYDSDGIVFTECEVRDCQHQDWGSDKMVPCNIIYMVGSGDSSYNGVPLRNGSNEVGDIDSAGNANLNLDAASGLHLYFFETEVTPENGGFTLYVGDDPITLDARDGSGNAVSGRWYSADPDKLSITPSADGTSCEVAILGAKDGGTVLALSVPGDELLIPVYLRAR